MAETDDIEEKEIREEAKQHVACHCFTSQTFLHKLVRLLQSLDRLSMFELLAPLRRHSQHQSHEEQRDHREESRVQRYPEVLNNTFPEERDVVISTRT